MERKYKRLKYACYTANITMSAVGNLSPVLFLTFRSLYGISYTLLGLLVLVNFVTQLSIDLVFSFFSHKFNIDKTVKIMPVLAIIGFILYGCSPWLFPNFVYLGLLLGTIIFSSASGLAEVLVSPIIEAIPAQNTEGELSKLHSVYAWGVVFVVVVCTVFLLLCGGKNWQWLAFGCALIPLFSAVLYAGVKVPTMDTPKGTSGALAYFKNKWLWVCVFAIFLGGASECTMAQWASGYIEKSLGISKVWGDIVGVAGFALTLGLGRSLYAKYGKNIGKVLFFGAIGATLCYAVTVFVNIPFIALLACGLTGFCVAMLWPGNLIVASEKFPTGGVFIFAMMAAGGDLGASVGPQLVGKVTDLVIANGNAVSWAQTLGMTVEQLGMKAGMCVGTLFPLVAIFLYLYIWKSMKKPIAKVDNADKTVA
jgi:MFS family permease